MIKYLFKFSVNNTFLYFFKRLPTIILPNKGDRKSITRVGILAPAVKYDTVIVEIINNSINMNNDAPYLNKKDFCVISIVLNSLLFFTILSYFG